jgi:phage shock protein E
LFAGAPYDTLSYVNDGVRPYTASSTRSATALVLGMVAVAAVFVLYMATGMPGMDHGSAMPAVMPEHVVSYRKVAPDAFAQIVGDPATVTINVHVPASEADLDGTDLRLPYNDLDVSDLPADLDTRLAVYCRSGNMSAEAVRTLTGIGYTDIVELEGGTDAWQASGAKLAGAAPLSGR